MESVGVPQPEPIEIVFRNPRHKHLNHIAAIRNLDLGLAIARCHDAGEGCWDERICGACIAENRLDKGGDGGRVAEVETCGDREDFIGGGGGEGNVEVSTSWICGSEGCGKEGREYKRACGKRSPH